MMDRAEVRETYTVKIPSRLNELYLLINFLGAYETRRSDVPGRKGYCREVACL